MTKDLEQLRTAAKQILNELSLREDNPIFNYILVIFRDPDIEPAVVTTDPQVMLQKLKEIKLIGNKDCPEMAIGGLKEGIKLALKNSIAFVISDATAKDFSEYRSVYNSMQKKQISATFLLTGDCGERDSEGYKVYGKLARYTNGEVFDMKSDGIKEVILAIRTQLDDEFTLLKYLIKDAAGTSIEDFWVDSSISQIQISISGSDPSMVIRNPLGEIVTGKETSMENINIVKILNPMPGKWTLEAKSSSIHSIRFGAISSLKLEYGFSVDTPIDPAETSKLPSKGVPNQLTVFIPDSSGINLTEAILKLEVDERLGRKRRELSGV
ncbi:unnamed protein product [Diamesa tonsa]